MDRYDSRYALDYTTHQDQVLDMIKDYHYFAPAMLARGESQARRLTEAALGRWEEPSELTVRTSSPMQAVRMRLSALLIRLGIRLRGGLADEPVVSTAIVASSSLANW